MDKNEAVAEFINTYPKLYSWLYFNTINMTSGDVSLITDSDNIIQEFNDGTQERNYVFNVAFMKEYDTGTSDVNMQAMQETQNFNRWIHEQDCDANYPDFGNDFVIGINPLSEIPLMLIDEESNVARYMLQINISYLKRKEQYNG